MSLSQYPKQDYRYFTSGEYSNRAPKPRVIHKGEATKTSSGLGKVCPSCGITRSKSNKCECNS